MKRNDAQAIARDSSLAPGLPELPCFRRLHETPPGLRLEMPRPPILAS